MKAEIRENVDEALHHIEEAETHLKHAAEQLGLNQYLLGAVFRNTIREFNRISEQFKADIEGDIE